MDQRTSSVLHVVLVKQGFLNIHKEIVIPCNLAMHTFRSQNRAFWPALSVQVCVSESLGTMQHLDTILLSVISFIASDGIQSAQARIRMEKWLGPVLPVMFTKSSVVLSS